MGLEQIGKGGQDPIEKWISPWQINPAEKPSGRAAS